MSELKNKDEQYNNLLKFRPFFMVIFQKKSDRGRFLTNMLEIKFEQLLNKKTVAQLTLSEQQFT